MTCPIEVLDLLREICKRRSMYDDAEISYNDAEIGKIITLQRTVYEKVTAYGRADRSVEAPPSRKELLGCLYRHAILIYLNRAFSNISTTSFLQSRLVRQGLALLQKLTCCESAWPLLILACEAHEDEQRLQILDILSDQGREFRQRSNHIPFIRSMVTTLWIQNDLNIGGNVSYVRTLDAVVSSVPFLPLFA